MCRIVRNVIPHHIGKTRSVDKSLKFNVPGKQRGPLFWVGFYYDFIPLMKKENDNVISNYPQQRGLIEN